MSLSFSLALRTKTHWDYELAGGLIMAIDPHERTHVEEVIWVLAEDLDNILHGGH